MTAATATKKASSKVSVAQYIEQQLALSDRSQKDIAEEVGYQKPNMLTMIKQGHTKLPMNKIVPMAKALGVDPLHLLRLTLNEYQPELWEVLAQVMGQSLVTEEEVVALRVLREAQRGVEIDFQMPEVKRAVVDALKPFVDAEIKSREGAADLVRKIRAK